MAYSCNESLHSRGDAGVEVQKEPGPLFVALHSHAQDACDLQRAKVLQHLSELRRSTTVRTTERVRVLQWADGLRDESEQQVDRHVALDQRHDVRGPEWSQIRLDEPFAGQGREGEGRPVSVLGRALSCSKSAGTDRSERGLQAGLHSTLQGVTRHHLLDRSKHWCVGVPNADEVE